MSEKDPPTKRKWTVLIYMAGDNNLSEEMVYSLTEAKDALTDNDDQLAVLAQFDPAGVRVQTRRYRLRGSKTQSLKQDAIATRWTASETDTGEPQNLLEFVRWGMSECPAEHFMLVLVGHGSGTDDDFLLRDDNPPNALSILELRQVFEHLTADGRTIDILGFDTCLMNMAEVSFELLRTNVTFMVGSEGFAPNTGWPYRNILTILGEHISEGTIASPEWLSRQIVDEYKTFYEPYISGGISVDQSVLEVKKIDEVKMKMFSLVDVLLQEFDDNELDYSTPEKPKPKQNALLLAHWETQSYNGERFVDLYDFCERLAVRYREATGYDGSNVTSEVIERCGLVQDAIAKLVIRSCAAGPAFQYSNGLSIYFPWAVCSPNYGNLAFARETRWLDFLTRYHEKTQREGRSKVELEPPFPPFRNSVPWLKGRDGYVESMRNPPTKDYSDCQDVASRQREPAETTSDTKTPKGRTKKRK
jgi:hypothetical protein